MHTVQDLIDDARIRHHAFSQANMPDGAVLRLINERARSTLLEAAQIVEPLLNESIQLAGTIDGALVAIDEDGVTPVYSTSVATGYAVSLDEDEVPYVDTTQAIAHDPFGVDGDTPGMPLPADLIRMTGVTAVLTSGHTTPIEVLDERMRHESAGSRRLQMFINGERLVPIRQPAGARGGDAWDSVASVQLSYVQWSDRTALAEDLEVPPAIYRVLVAHLVEWLASASQGVPTDARRDFTSQRREAEAALQSQANAVLDGLTTSSVVYRRRR